MDQSAVPYILDEFAYYFETPYDVTDPKFADCSLDRPGGASDLGRMYIVNHFLDIEILPNVKVPHVLAAFKTNSVASITAQTDLCQKKWGRPPQVVLVSLCCAGARLSRISLVSRLRKAAAGGLGLPENKLA